MPKIFTIADNVRILSVLEKIAKQIIIDIYIPDNLKIIKIYIGKGTDFVF